MSSPTWSRLPCDNEESWQAFVTYRDSKPPRRLQNVVNTNTAQAMTWYKENGWRERVAAYDAHLDEIILEERAAILRQSTRDVTAEHLAALASGRDLFALEMSRILAATRDAGTAPCAIMRPAELIKLGEMVIKLERLIHGEVTDRTEKRVDLSQLSDAELVVYEKLSQKVTPLAEPVH